MPVLERKAVDSQAEARKRALTRELFDEIQTEAYFLWQRRGSPHGDDWRDWFAAQNKVLSEATALSARDSSRVEDEALVY